MLDFALAVPVERLSAAWSDDALRECRLLEMGAGVPPMFTFSDPDGNRLYVVERPA